ncbi:hypothetical protein DFQ12_2502, partial [Sphingobacterium detergens]
GGRVGRCLFLHGSPCWKQSRASFVYILPKRFQKDNGTAIKSTGVTLGKAAQMFRNPIIWYKAVWLWPKSHTGIHSQKPHKRLSSGIVLSSTNLYNYDLRCCIILSFSDFSKGIHLDIFQRTMAPLPKATQR